MIRVNFKHPVDVRIGYKIPFEKGNTMNKSTTDIWNFFKAIFPHVSKDVKQFRSHGGNAITLWFSDKGPFIFTIMADKSWKLEPYKM